jgi:hypothetical protein
MLVLTSSERHEQAWRAANNLPIIPHDALFVLRIATMAHQAIMLEIPLSVPIHVNDAGLKLISSVAAQYPDWKDWQTSWQLFGRPLEVLPPLPTPLYPDDYDDVAYCAIAGVPVPEDIIVEAVSDLLDG